MAGGRVTAVLVGSVRGGVESVGAGPGVESGEIEGWGGVRGGVCWEVERWGGV